MAAGCMIRLDERLSTVAGLFPVSENGADIGADHGRLACYLLQSGKCKHMIVSDISTASLEKAKTLLSRFALDERVTFVVADGFDALCRPVGAAAVCGMGGQTIAAMLETNPAPAGNSDLILSAHTELPRLRAALMNCHYAIVREVIACSGGRFYHVLHARHGQNNYTDKQIKIGAALTSKDPQDLLRYYQWKLGLQERKRPRDEQVINWLREEIAACHSYA